MADDEDIAALVVDNGSGMCKGKILQLGGGLVMSVSPHDQFLASEKSVVGISRNGD